jgi:hypothetical protein
MPGRAAAGPDNGPTYAGTLAVAPFRGEF